jgi:hypothetical protein
MNTAVIENELPYVQGVRVTLDTLAIELSDGLTISVPLGWFPRLEHGRPDERSNWRLIGKGHGIYWPDLDEDISFDGLLAGKPSGESQASFKKWLQKRTSRTANP